MTTVERKAIIRELKDFAYREAELLSEEMALRAVKALEAADDHIRTLEKALENAEVSLRNLGADGAADMLREMWSRSTK